MDEPMDEEVTPVAGQLPYSGTGDRRVNAASDERLQTMLDTVVDMTSKFTDEATALRADVKTIDEKGERDREIIRQLSTQLDLLQRQLRLTLIALCVMIVVGVSLIPIGVSTYHNSHASQQNSELLADCLTPSGTCFKRLSLSNVLNQDITVLRIEDNRIATQIAAAKASQDAGSPTASATIVAYTAQKADIEAQIKTKQDQLNALGPLNAPGPVQ